MSASNGAKKFLYVVTHKQAMLNHTDRGGTFTYIVRSDHDPDQEELVEALHLEYDEMHDELEAIRYDEASVPTIPPKKS